MQLPVNHTVKIITAKVRHNKIMFMITLKILYNNVYVVLQQLVPEDILSIQLLNPLTLQLHKLCS